MDIEIFSERLRGLLIAAGKFYRAYPEFTGESSSRIGDDVMKEIESSLPDIGLSEKDPDEYRTWEYLSTSQTPMYLRFIVRDYELWRAGESRHASFISEAVYSGIMIKAMRSGIMIRGDETANYGTLFVTEVLKPHAEILEYLSRSRSRCVDLAGSLVGEAQTGMFQSHSCEAIVDPKSSEYMINLAMNGTLKSHEKLLSTLLKVASSQSFARGRGEDRRSALWFENLFNFELEMIFRREWERNQ